MTRNFELLERLGVADLDKISDRRSVVLLGEAPLAFGSTELVLYVDATAPSVEAAIGGLTDDGVNPLPSFLVDLDADPCELIALRYDPIRGLSQIEIACIDDPDLGELVRSYREEDRW